MDSTKRTRILILGGGFGGVHTALNLERLLKRELREGRVEIGLLDTIPTRTLISTVPSMPNPLVAARDEKKERGRIVVDQHLALADHGDVWALGDCAWSLDARTGEPAPPTAQHATRQARCVAENIAASLRGAPKRAFSFQALGKMGALGHRSAVAEVFGVKISGFLAWWLWRTVYLMKLPGLDRKIRVATDWTLDLILPPDIVQLKTDKPLGIRREHFEAGEVVCREGDRGDWRKPPRRRPRGLPGPVLQPSPAARLLRAVDRYADPVRRGVRRVRDAFRLGG